MWDLVDEYRTVEGLTGWVGVGVVYKVLLDFVGKWFQTRHRHGKYRISNVLLTPLRSFPSNYPHRPTRHDKITRPARSAQIRTLDNPPPNRSA